MPIEFLKVIFKYIFNLYKANIVPPHSALNYLVICLCLVIAVHFIVLHRIIILFSHVSFYVAPHLRLEKTIDRRSKLKSNNAPSSLFFRVGRVGPHVGGPRRRLRQRLRQRRRLLGYR